MIHINPYYIFANVIFINIEKKFIFIEKSCWTMVHGLIFNNELSTPTQRRRLRKLLYDFYYDYVYNKIEVDVLKFNQQLFFIYNHIFFKDETNHLSIVDGDGDAIIHDEEPFYFEQKDDEVRKIDDPIITDIIERSYEFNSGNDLSDKLNVLLNYWISHSWQFHEFVKWYGWGRLLNNIKKFLFVNNCKFIEYEEFFAINFLSQDISKLRLQFFKKTYFYICKNCLTVNTHRYERIRNYVSSGQISQHELSCSSSDVQWYNSNGKLELNYGIEDVDARDKVFIRDDKLTGFSNRTSFRLGNKVLDINSSVTYDNIINSFKLDNHLNDFQTRTGINLNWGQFNLLEFGFKKSEWFCNLLKTFKETDFNSDFDQINDFLNTIETCYIDMVKELENSRPKIKLGFNKEDFLKNF